MEKLELLSKIAHDLNQDNITWNLGASCMLYLRDIVSEFHDIDIMIKEEDITKVEKIMSKYGLPSKREPNEKYKTKHFLEYNIDGIEIDIMAGFVIVNQDIEYRFPLKDTDPFDVFILKGTKIKLAKVETWYKYYSLMERTDKVNLLSNYIKD